MRAVIYCRVSTTEQAQNLSLPTQEKACREYCQRQGYEVAEVFVDAGESAKTTNRPEFLRLLATCRKQRGRLHAVVVYSLTRFSRNTADHHAIVTLLRGLGIALRSVTEPIDDSPSGRLMEGILAAMAQFDSDVRSERVTAGMRAAMERGRWVFWAPIGYLRGRPGEASLVPDPERAPAVREAFDLAARGVLGQPLTSNGPLCALQPSAAARGGSTSLVHPSPQVPLGEGAARPGLQVPFERQRAGLVAERDSHVNPPRPRPRRVTASSRIVVFEPLAQVRRYASVVARRFGLAAEDVDDALRSGHTTAGKQSPSPSECLRVLRDFGRVRELELTAGLLEQPTFATELTLRRFGAHPSPEGAFARGDGKAFA